MFIFLTEVYFRFAVLILFVQLLIKLGWDLLHVKVEILFKNLLYNYSYAEHEVEDAILYTKRETNLSLIPVLVAVAFVSFEYVDLYTGHN